MTNYYFVTYASVFGDDPNPAINALAKKLHAGTGGFVTGSAAIDGVVTAINRAHGSTTGSVLAGVMEKFNKVPTLSGLVSFSPTQHTVFGRQYRVVKIQNNKPHVVGEVVAKVVVKLQSLLGGVSSGNRGGEAARTLPEMLAAGWDCCK